MNLYIKQLEKFRPDLPLADVQIIAEQREKECCHLKRLRKNKRERRLARDYWDNANLNAI